MTERPTGGERLPWLLTLIFFALGGLWLASSFFSGGGASTTESIDETAAGAETSDVEGAAVENETETNPDRLDRFTISVSGDILIHERVGDAARTGENTFNFDPLFAPVQNLIASRDFSICHLEVPISSTNQDLSFSSAAFRAPMELPQALRNAGFDSCSVASNHAWDSGCLLYTSDAADE